MIMQMQNTRSRKAGYTDLGNFEVPEKLKSNDDVIQEIKSDIQRIKHDIATLRKEIPCMIADAVAGLARFE
jgi:hypothetical protein